MTDGQVGGLYWSGQRTALPVDLETAMELILPAFPMAKLRMYMHKHGYSNPFERLFYDTGQTAVTLNLATLFVTLGLYISLTTCPAGEDETGVALAAWSKVGIPATLACYVVVAMVIILVMVSNTNDAYRLGGSPSSDPGAHLTMLLFTTGIPIVIGAGAGLPLALYLYAGKKLNDEEEKLNSTVQPYEVETGNTKQRVASPESTW